MGTTVQQRAHLMDYKPLNIIIQWVHEAKSSYHCGQVWLTKSLTNNFWSVSLSGGVCSVNTTSLRWMCQLQYNSAYLHKENHGDYLRLPCGIEKTNTCVMACWLKAYLYSLFKQNRIQEKRPPRKHQLVKCCAVTCTLFLIYYNIYFVNNKLDV